ncbi:MAG: penicillin acylase family protein [Actinomycetota bacterium]|nr:penicillin acylase family protein [Actinomycetota bacterium]
MDRSVSATLLAAVAIAIVPATTQAETIDALGILPPGQSGFVSVTGLTSGTGSPHLTDQTQLFEDFEYRDITFNQPGDVETPRPGVTISRDDFGVPTIDGETEDDAWFGVGYAVAQDRLFQLDLFRRATSGRLSEILGPGFLDDDLIARRDYYTDAEVQSMLDGIPQRLVDRTQSYADGINAWINEVSTTSPQDMPGEFVALADLPIEQWTILDSARVGVFLARTVPSSDGAELGNALALADAGPKAFKRLLPVKTKGQISTIPRSEGKFPAQPGRSAQDRRKGFRKSRKFLAKQDLENVVDTTQEIPRSTGAPQSPADEPGAGLRSILPSPGGSFMWAMRDPENGQAYLYNGPQLGFTIPELFVEFELHSPDLKDIHGVSAAGIPLIGIGHNGKVAWGFTSGLSDEDDLYVEKVTGPETYRFKGEERAMDCRDETFIYKTPPTDLPGTLTGLIEGGGSSDAPPAGTTTERICRTIHGPVQQTGDGIALARKYAIWNRELETIVGIDKLNRAKDIGDVDEAMDAVTWNENVIAADSDGHIGYWHPGLHQVKPKAWDERLPFPGTGRAEWRGLLPKDKRPQVIDPAQGWLAQWNNVPSAGWTNGDSEALERATGSLHRVGILNKLVGKVAKNPSFERSTDIALTSGTTAQQFPIRDKRKLKRARKLTDGDGRALLDALKAWNGSYDKENAGGTVDPGVAIWEELKTQIEAVLLKKLDAEGIGIAGNTSNSHMFDITNGEAAAMRKLGAPAYAKAASKAFSKLASDFGSQDVSTWREERRLYPVGAQGAGATPELEFFDRGTWNQSIAMGE